ncbi:hypothetical protein [Pseudomonas gessardii]|uniref:Uncharacterized protein n=1 Tax=Pseudomonas gessardii TaxID=78544 RepID=A0A7Y1MNE2_9PSED|nr:hypothetical protein [Pseudomonas gessardii]MRU48797.1 hypothetical protein [Pseudomonas gessardii]NNA95107.1 hypothetical protein [Pseudomonas gessardii]ONH49191.1 hypothetical protein BLL38_00540 [Pseudomonas gessardii]
MQNTYDFLSFDGLPAAEITETGDKLTITAQAIPNIDKGQEVVFFLRTPMGHGIAIYLALQQDNLKRPMVIEIDKSQLPKARELHIDYGAYDNRRAVHRSAVAYYPPRETAA